MIVFEPIGMFGGRIVLLMGDVTKEEFKTIFNKIGLKELEDRNEGLINLWIRALKLWTIL